MAPENAIDPTGRFTERAGDYAAHRPDYPPACIAMLAALAEQSAAAHNAPRRVADIGAGTGILTRQLAGAGLPIDAVEPNAAMRNAAAPHPHITWHDATGEQTGLPDRSVALTACAQAFHWLRPQEAILEFARILVPGGHLAIVFNTIAMDDPASAAYRSILEAHATEPPRSPRPGEGERLAVSAIEQAPELFAAPEIHRFPHAQHLTRDALIGRAASASYVPKPGTPQGDAMAAELRALHDRSCQNATLIALRYQTIAITARRR
ncbi:MAG: class I SAM-dependent methyltransferase [Phycisphaerales bacterium]